MLTIVVTDSQGSVEVTVSVGSEVEGVSVVKVSEVIGIEVSGTDEEQVFVVTVVVMGGPTGGVEVITEVVTQGSVV